MKNAIFLIPLVFLILNCGNKQRETELLNKIQTLETQLDECQNGAEKLHAKIKIAFENEEFETCKSIYKEMERRHPDSELFAEVKKINQAVIDTERKIEEEKIKLAQEEKKIRLQALNKLKKNFDEVSNRTWYYQSYFTHYTNTNLVSVYMGKTENSLWLRLKMSYEGDDWIFFEKAYLSFDGQTREIIFDQYKEKETENGDGGRVWEWIDVAVSDDLISFLKEFSSSKNAKMRLTGKYTKTRNLTLNERKGIQDVLNGYTALKEEIQN